MTEIPMPRLSDSMDEGTILKWLIESGQPVAKGDELVEIETDKANMTYESDAEGVLEILAAEGDTLAVGEPIARIGQASGQAPAQVAGEAASTPSSDPGDGAMPTSPAADAGAEPESRPEPESPPEPAPMQAEPGDVAATPLARRAAASHGVALATVAGSGPRGRITKGDVLVAAGVASSNGDASAAGTHAPVETPRVPEAPPAPAKAPPPTEGSELVAMTRLQQVVARRMVEAKSVPDFQVQTEVEMDEAIALRGRLKELAGDEPAPSINDLVVKAVAIALRKHLRANATFREEGFELHARVNVGVAVAADDALVVPVVTDADRKSLGEIARDVRRLAERVRSGAITPPELSGGTFTVSNLGMFGMTAMTPVINLPQAAILGVGAARAVLTRDASGAIVDRQLLTLTLTCDHRVLYGADAARFLADIKALLEAPLRIAL